MTVSVSVLVSSFDAGREKRAREWRRAPATFAGGRSSSDTKRWLLRLTAVLCLLTPGPLAAAVYQAPPDFVREAFAGHPPNPSMLWITKRLKPAIHDILGRDLGVLRMRYWGLNGRTIWILEEIGKEEPITTGIVVNRGAIEQVKVLIFRESRGWEIRYPVFTDQFKHARLDDEKRLDRNVDGITGATLSVRAVNKLARLALYLHQDTPFAEDAS